jgi:hypothetical protein
MTAAGIECDRFVDIMAQAGLTPVSPTITYIVDVKSMDEDSAPIPWNHHCRFFMHPPRSIVKVVIKLRIAFPAEQRDPRRGLTTSEQARRKGEGML